MALSYECLQPPLRPSPDDLQFLENQLAEWAAEHPGRPLRALLLGVTPDLAGMRWPSGSSLVAVDSSMAMIRGVWPGNVPGRRRAVCADWLAMPFRPQSFDLVLGDGSINCVRYPASFHTLVSGVSRLLAPGGLLLLRCYVRPPAAPAPEQVIANAARCASFSDLKLRLMMTLQESTESGIAVDDVYRYWIRNRVDEADLAARTGWDPRVIRSIENYRDSSTVHHFPTLDELHAIFCGSLDAVRISDQPHPVIALRPKANGRRAYAAAPAARKGARLSRLHAQRNSAEPPRRDAPRFARDPQQ